MKKRGFGYFLLRTVSAVLAFILGAGLYFFYALGYIKHININAIRDKNDIQNYQDVEDEGSKFSKVKINVDSDYPIKEVKQKDAQVENILVFGIDSRGEDSSRADSIIIVTVDRRNGEIKLTSVLRDTQMHMNSMEGETNKVNAAYAFGGVGMLINTLNSNLDLDIQRFVMFDFWSAVKFVDAANGVKINIEEREIGPTNDVISSMAKLLNEKADNHYLKNSGEQSLNGIQAISWARVRRIDSDFGRTSRQRTLMEALISKFKTMNIVEKGRFAIDVLPELESNLDRNNIIRLGINALGGLNDSYQYYVPQEGMFWVNENNWNMIFDPAVQIPALHDFIWQKQKD